MDKNVEAWIASHRDELIEDIRRLVHFESVAGEYDYENGYGVGCTKVLEEMLEMGKEYGFKTRNIKNICAEICNGIEDKSKKTVALWNHLDVVPASGEWKYPPFECVEQSGFLIGRGVQDNKGPAVAVLYAMRCISELDIPLSYNLKQILGCNEEKGMDDAEYYVKNQPIPDLSLVADSGFPVCYGEKGILEVVLKSQKLDNKTILIEGGTVSNLVPDMARAEWCTENGLKQAIFSKGISAHTAFPQGGENAIAALCKNLLSNHLFSENDKRTLSFINEICMEYRGKTLGIACTDEEFGELTCVGSIIKTVDESILLTCNIRYCPQKSFDELLSCIKSVASSFGFTVADYHNSNPNYFDKSSPVVEALTQVYNSVTNSDAKPFVMGGGTYARKIPNAVAFGPGLTVDNSVLNLPKGHGDCHTPDEAQSIESLLKAIKIYVLSFIRLNEFF